MGISRRTFLLSGAGAALSLLAPRPVRAGGAWSALSAYNQAQHGVSLRVVRHGRVLVDEGSGAYELASGTKSFWGTLAVMLARRRQLALDDRLGEVIGEWRADPRGAITLRQLLTLSSGLEGGHIMRVPTVRDALQTRLVSAPGQVFHYGPNPFQIFGEYLRRRFSADPLALLETHVLRPAGVGYARWRRCSDGSLHLPSGASLTAADWGRFGAWGLGEDLGPCFEGTSANPAYGLTWWLPRPVPPSVAAGLNAHMRAITRLGSDVPRDLHVAAGAGDQRLYVIPSLGVVAVRQADRILQRMLRGRSDWSDAEFLRLLLAAL